MKRLLCRVFGHCDYFEYDKDKTNNEIFVFRMTCLRCGRITGPPGPWISYAREDYE